MVLLDFLIAAGTSEGVFELCALLCCAADNDAELLGHNTKKGARSLQRVVHRLGGYVRGPEQCVRLQNCCVCLCWA